MDQAWSNILSAGIGAIAGLSGASLTLWRQQRSEHMKWLREQVKMAYSSTLKALSRATIIPIGTRLEELGNWFNVLSEVRESLIVLQIYCSEGRERVVDRSTKLFSVIDENNYALLATTVTTITEAEGDTSGLVLLGVGRIRSEIVVVLEEVTNSARADLKRSLIG